MAGTVARALNTEGLRATGRPVRNEAGTTRTFASITAACPYRDLQSGELARSAVNWPPCCLIDAANDCCVRIQACGHCGNLRSLCNVVGDLVHCQSSLAVRYCGDGGAVALALRQHTTVFGLRASRQCPATLLSYVGPAPTPRAYCEHHCGLDPASPAGLRANRSGAEAPYSQHPYRHAILTSS